MAERLGKNEHEKDDHCGFRGNHVHGHVHGFPASLRPWIPPRSAFSSSRSGLPSSWLASSWGLGTWRVPFLAGLRRGRCRWRGRFGHCRTGAGRRRADTDRDHDARRDDSGCDHDSGGHHDPGRSNGCADDNDRRDLLRAVLPPDGSYPVGQCALMCPVNAH